MHAPRGKKAQARVAELVAEEMSLRDLRAVLEKTQVTVAKQLKIAQDGISRLEKRSDLLVSTLRAYVKAIGGNVSLVAEFPNREPVIPSGIAGIGPEERK